MEYRYTIWLLVTILAYRGQPYQGRGAQFKYFKELHNQTSAVTYCEQRESLTLPPIGTVKDHLVLTSFLREHRIQETWLDSKRQQFAQYKWVDGSHVDPALSRLGQRLGYSCGVLDLALGAYDFRPCSRNGLSYICQVTECAHCTDVGMTSNNCITNGNVCYIFHCGAINWWDAEVKCRNFNGSLAIVKDKKSRNTFRSFWNNNFLGPCSNSWIGIRRETWTHQEQSSVAFWAKNEPADGKDCLILSKEWDDYLWNAASCEEVREFACHKKADTAQITTTEDLMSHTSIPYSNPTKSSIFAEKRSETDTFMDCKTAFIITSAATSALCGISLFINILIVHRVTTRNVRKNLKIPPSKEHLLYSSKN